MPRRGQRAIGRVDEEPVTGLDRRDACSASTTATRHGPAKTAKPRRSTGLPGGQTEVRPGRPATRVFSRPPVAFQAASMSLITSSSFWPSAGSTDALTFETCLGRVPEQLVQVRDLLDVLGLEVVVPQDVEVVLDQLGALFLDPDRAGAEGRRRCWPGTSP